MGGTFSSEAEGQGQAGQEQGSSGVAERPSALVVCGPSGVGKGTLIKKLMDGSPLFGFSCSHTTRAPREGEKVNWFMEAAAFLQAELCCKGSHASMGRLNQSPHRSSASVPAWACDENFPKQSVEARACGCRTVCTTGTPPRRSSRRASRRAASWSMPTCTATSTGRPSR